MQYSKSDKRNETETQTCKRTERESERQKIQKQRQMYRSYLILSYLSPSLVDRRGNRLVGQVVKASASGAEDPGFESRLRRDFSRSSHTSELKIGTSVATLQDAWHYRVSAGTGRSGVSILWVR